MNERTLVHLSSFFLELQMAATRTLDFNIVTTSLLEEKLLSRTQIARSRFVVSKKLSELLSRKTI